MHALRHLFSPESREDAAEVEEHLRVEQGIGLRRGDPPVEGVVPLRLCHPPLRVVRHDAPGAQRLPRFREAGADVVAEAREVVAVQRGVEGIIEHQRVVLVGGGAHLAAGLGSDGDEREWDGWLAELGNRQRV